MTSCMQFEKRGLDIWGQYLEGKTETVSALERDRKREEVSKKFSKLVYIE